jgi:hypothetical protein
MVEFYTTVRVTGRRAQASDSTPARMPLCRQDESADDDLVNKSASGSALQAAMSDPLNFAAPHEFDAWTVPNGSRVHT